MPVVWFRYWYIQEATNGRVDGIRMLGEYSVVHGMVSKKGGMEDHRGLEG